MCMLGIYKSEMRGRVHGRDESLGDLKVRRHALVLKAFVYSFHLSGTTNEKSLDCSKSLHLFFSRLGSPFGKELEVKTVFRY